MAEFLFYVICCWKWQQSVLHGNNKYLLFQEGVFFNGHYCCLRTKSAISPAEINMHKGTDLKTCFKWLDSSTDALFGPILCWDLQWESGCVCRVQVACRADVYLQKMGTYIWTFSLSKKSLWGAASCSVTTHSRDSIQLPNDVWSILADKSWPCSLLAG